MARKRRIRSLRWRSNSSWPTMAASSRGKGGNVTRKRRKTRTARPGGYHGYGTRAARSRKRFLGLF